PFRGKGTRVCSSQAINPNDSDRPGEGDEKIRFVGIIFYSFWAPSCCRRPGLLFGCNTARNRSRTSSESPRPRREINKNSSSNGVMLQVSPSDGRKEITS